MSNEEIRALVYKTLDDIAKAVRESGKPMPESDKSAVEAVLIAVVSNLTDDKETIETNWIRIKIILACL